MLTSVHHFARRCPFPAARSNDLRCDVGWRNQVMATVYDGPCQLSVEDVPDARIERSADVLVRITAADGGDRR